MYKEDNRDKFTDEKILQIVKSELNRLDIAYEETPGDWRCFLVLDPRDLYEEDMQPPGA